MTDEFNIWLDGAPVITTPGGEQFSIWLDGSPVVTSGGDSVTAVVTGSECNAETGTVVATGGAVATVTGSECNCETGTCIVQGQIPCTGSEAECETGTVTATGGANASVTGSESHCETGIVTVTVINPPPPPPPVQGFAGAHTFHRIHSVRYPKPMPEKHRKRKHSRFDDDYTAELPEEIPTVSDFATTVVIARVQGSEFRAEAGIVRARVDHPDDQETIKLILEAMEMVDFDAGDQSREKPRKNHRKPSVYKVENPNDHYDLEAILMVLEEV